MFDAHLVIELNVWNAITGAQAANLSHLFFTPNPTMKDESECQERGQQAQSISSVATYSVQRSPIFFEPEAVGWPVGKKKNPVWMGMLKINFTHMHTHARTHAHIRAHQIFGFWLYKPLVPLSFVRVCVFDLSRVSLSMQCNLSLTHVKEFCDLLDST